MTESKTCRKFSPARPARCVRWKKPGRRAAPWQVSIPYTKSAQRRTLPLYLLFQIVRGKIFSLFSMPLYNTNKRGGEAFPFAYQFKIWRVKNNSPVYVSFSLYYWEEGSYLCTVSKPSPKVSGIQPCPILIQSLISTPLILEGYSLWAHLRKTWISKGVQAGTVSTVPFSIRFLLGLGGISLF